MKAAIVAIEKGGKRSGRNPVQPLKQFPAGKPAFGLQPLRKIHLINISGANITLGAFDGGKKISADEARGDARCVLPDAGSRVGSCILRQFSRGEFADPELHLFRRPPLHACAIATETGGDDADRAEVMVEDDEAVIEAHMAIGQFQVIHGAAVKFWLDETLQVVTPITKRATQRKRQVDFVQDFATGQERVENLPGVAELDIRHEARSMGPDFTARAEGTKGQKWPRRDK